MLAQIQISAFGALPGGSKVLESSWRLKVTLPPALPVTGALVGVAAAAVVGLPPDAAAVVAGGVTLALIVTPVGVAVACAPAAVGDAPPVSLSSSSPQAASSVAATGNAAPT